MQSLKTFNFFNNMFLLKSCLPALFFILASCQNQTDVKTKGKSEQIQYTPVQISVENITPTVDIEKYVLINSSNEDRKDDAEEILKTKRKWPLAMQSKSASAFDSILTDNFIFTGNGQLINKKDYIADRTSPSEWKITFVKYDNMTLQFFGEYALLTYRNQVTNENVDTKAIEIENINWADVYKNENNQWKIEAAHVVDMRIENKQ